MYGNVSTLQARRRGSTLKVQRRSSRGRATQPLLRPAVPAGEFMSAYVCAALTPCHKPTRPRRNAYSKPLIRDRGIKGVSVTRAPVQSKVRRQSTLRREGTGRRRGQGERGARSHLDAARPRPASVASQWIRWLARIFPVIERNNGNAVNARRDVVLKNMLRDL